MEIAASHLRRVKVVAVILSTGFYIVLQFQKTPQSLWHLRCDSYTVRLPFSYLEVF